MNRRILLLILMAIALLSGQALAQQAPPAPAKVYAVALLWDGGRLSLVDVTVQPGYSTPTSGTYRYDVVSFKGVTLASARFEPVIPVSSTPPPPGQTPGPALTVPSQVKFALLIPYFYNAKVIRLYGPSGDRLLEVDVSTQAKCNENAVCEPNLGENYATCPQDCPSGSADNYCDGVADGRCDPDCSAATDPDCSAAPTRLPPGASMTRPSASPGFEAVLALAALGLLALVLRKRR